MALASPPPRVPLVTLQWGGGGAEHPALPSCAAGSPWQGRLMGVLLLDGPWGPRMGRCSGERPLSGVTLQQDSCSRGALPPWAAGGPTRACPHSVVCPRSRVLQGPCHGPLLCRTQQGCRQLVGSRVGSTPLESCVPWGPGGAACQNVLATDSGTAWGGSSPALPCRAGCWWWHPSAGAGEQGLATQGAAPAPTGDQGQAGAGLRPRAHECLRRWVRDGDVRGHAGDCRGWDRGDRHRGWNGAGGGGP